MANFEEILGGIGNAILHYQIDVDDILIAGQHQRFGGNIRIACRRTRIDAPEADLYPLHLGHLRPQNGFERIGPMPMEPRVHGGYMLTKAKDDSPLVRPNGVGTASEPQYHHHPDHDTEELRADLLEPQRRQAKGCPPKPPSRSFAKIEIIPCHGDAPAALRYPLRAWSLPAAPAITITEPP